MLLLKVGCVDRPTVEDPQLCPDGKENNTDVDPVPREEQEDEPRVVTHTPTEGDAEGCGSPVR